jgi:hypothetical protein
MNDNALDCHAREDDRAVSASSYLTIVPVPVLAGAATCYLFVGQEISVRSLERPTHQGIIVLQYQHF